MGYAEPSLHVQNTIFILCLNQMDPFSRAHKVFSVSLKWEKGLSAEVSPAPLLRGGFREGSLRFPPLANSYTQPKQRFTSNLNITQDTDMHVMLNHEPTLSSKFISSLNCLSKYFFSWTVTVHSKIPFGAV